MLVTSEAVEKLVDQLSKLPTIGRKSAQRLTAYILKMPREEVVEIADAMVGVKDKVINCSICFNITDIDPCPICTSSRRNSHIICVVEEPNDVMAFERTNEFTGMYHIIGGAISPLEGVGPADLKIRELVHRVHESKSSEMPIEEVILALNPNVEGDTTSFYISGLLQPLGIIVSRIARGLPVGSDIEYADEATLGRALEGRQKL